MLSIANPSHSFPTALLLFGAAILNALTIGSAVIGGLCLFALLFVCGTSLGPYVYRGDRIALQVVLGALGTICALLIALTAVFYLSPGIPFFALSFGTLIVLSVIALLPSRGVEPALLVDALQWLRSSSYAFVALCLVTWWLRVSSVDITAGVRSLWTVIDPSLITALGLGAVIVFGLLSRKFSVGSASLLALTLFSALSLAASAYPLGYGFDPFIHRATVEHIAAFGSISPKPLYYIGQYVLELVGTSVFSLPTLFFDSLLVPTMASIMIVACASLMRDKGSRLDLCALALLPLGAFISTTPQSLAYTFSACVIFLSIRMFRSGDIPLWFLWALGITAVATHPIAGILTIVYLAILTAYLALDGRRRQQSIAALAALGCLSLPAAFLIHSALSGLSSRFSLLNLLHLSDLHLVGFLANRFNSWLDFIYLFLDNYLLILVILAIVGLFLSFRHEAWQALPLVMAGICLINYWILSQGFAFDYLIDYERYDFARRTLTLAALFLLPLCAEAFSRLRDRLRGSSIVAAFVVLSSLVFCANVYGAYPRHDGYARSSGFNVSQLDFDAVNLIEDLSGGEDYIVLANQTVSSAALASFGFGRYYANDVYFYPIPTSGPLYMHYLGMVEGRADERFMQAATDLADVQLGYLVVNDYWWRSDELREYAKQDAFAWYSVGEDEEIMIFEYRFSGEF